MDIQFFELLDVPKVYLFSASVLQIEALVLLGRTTDQTSEIFLRLAKEFFQGTYELVFVHWIFQEVKRTGYDLKTVMSVRRNTMASQLRHPGQERNSG
jgi:hypothetical protein